MNRRKREKDERSLANSCVTILAELVGRELGMHPVMRKDGLPYIEYYSIDKNTGKKTMFMRVDVLVRIFETETP